MEKLHTRTVQFSSNKFGNIVPIQAIPGHFVTSHSHVNYFIDLTMLKSSQEDAQKCAHALASQYKDIDSIDTIICLDGTGIIGAFLSVELQKKTPASEHKKIYVICPECANNGQMFFRENVEPMVCEKNVILLLQFTLFSYSHAVHLFSQAMQAQAKTRRKLLSSCVFLLFLYADIIANFKYFTTSPSDSNFPAADEKTDCYGIHLPRHEKS